MPNVRIFLAILFRECVFSCKMFGSRLWLCFFTSKKYPCIFTFPFNRGWCGGAALVLQTCIRTLLLGAPFSFFFLPPPPHFQDNGIRGTLCRWLCGASFRPSASPPPAEPLAPPSCHRPAAAMVRAAVLLLLLTMVLATLSQSTGAPPIQPSAIRKLSFTIVIPRSMMFFQWPHRSTKKSYVMCVWNFRPHDRFLCSCGLSFFCHFHP